MLDSTKDIMCGIFDSTVNMRNKSRSEPRKVTYYELELFTEKKGCSHIDGVSYPIHRGMLLCARPGQVRFSNLPVRCHYIRLIATEKEEAALLASFPPVSTIAESDVDTVSALFFKLASSLIGDMEKPLRDLRVNAVFWDILYRCKRSTAYLQALPSNAAGTVTVMKAKEFIDDNFKGSCTLSQIADHVHISPNHLHTVFKQKIGVTPLEYIMEKRIDSAKQKIMADNGSLLQIALELGFSSQSHFNRVFKRITGMTPSVYRKILSTEY